MATTTGRRAHLARLGNVDLVEEIYGLVQRVEQDELSVEFYWLLEEAFSRFSPDVEFEIVRRNNVDGEEGLRQAIERMGAQHVARLTAQAEAVTA